MPEEVVRELLRTLNELGEHERIEAKAGSDVGRSVLETVCAFANEPGLDGGDILLGVERTGVGDLFEPGGYEVVGVPDPEKVADDLASQCASAFNRSLRPRIMPVSVDGRTVLHIQVAEAMPGGKPVFFKRQGLPGGALRRVGATDQRCTDDDVQLLYDARRRTPYDADVVPEARWRDIDLDVVQEYRDLRREIAPEAEELRWSDEELLLALRAVGEADGELRPTVAGLLLFGTSMALRRFFGMLRVDYIRVPGRDWVPDPDERYSAIPIRAPLIRAVRRAEAAIVDDLPRAFRLPAGSLHREDVLPLPRKVLREALVNALMHRDYRVHGATQIIRYANRIEIRNPGYSLKAPERLGDPGSEARNPTIAAVFHDTNLAETKGTGIRVMRRLMREAELVPPTFESDRRANLFTARLLLHHFLGPDDLAWLDGLGVSGLSAEEKLVLVFVREVGAVDNATYRDLTGAETLRASAGLRHLCELRLLEKRGQSTATHYVPTGLLGAGRGVVTPDGAESSVAGGESGMARGEPGMVGGKPPMPLRDPAMVEAEPTLVGAESSMAGAQSSMAGTESSMAGGQSSMGSGDDSVARQRRRDELYGELSEPLQRAVDRIGPKADRRRMAATILILCHQRAYSAEELALLLGRYADYLKTHYLKPMLRAGELHYTIPDMPKHPHQAYRAAQGAR